MGKSELCTTFNTLLKAAVCQTREAKVQVKLETAIENFGSYWVTAYKERREFVKGLVKLRRVNRLSIIESIVLNNNLIKSGINRVAKEAVEAKKKHLEHKDTTFNYCAARWEIIWNERLDSVKRLIRSLIVKGNRV